MKGERARGGASVNTIVQWCNPCKWRTKHFKGACIECHPEIVEKERARLTKREVIKRERAPLFDDPNVGRRDKE